MIRAIIEERAPAGKIVLLATHDLVSASCACDCLCCLNQRLVSYGPTQDTYTAENLAATYGGPVIMLRPEGLPPPRPPPRVPSSTHAPHHVEHPTSAPSTSPAVASTTDDATRSTGSSSRSPTRSCSGP